MHNWKLFFLISQPKHMLWVLKNLMILLSTRNTWTCLDKWVRKELRFQDRKVLCNVFKKWHMRYFMSLLFTWKGNISLFTEAKVPFCRVDQHNDLDVLKKHTKHAKYLQPNFLHLSTCAFSHSRTDQDLWNSKMHRCSGKTNYEIEVSPPLLCSHVW